MASRPSSSSPVDLDPLRQVAGLGDRLGRLGQPPHRRERRSRDEQPEAGRDGDPAGGDQEQEERDPVEGCWFDLGERTRELDRIGRPTAIVNTRNSVPLARFDAEVLAATAERSLRGRAR